ncbi:MAG TPA: PqqD family protein [Myxococcales bacterium]|jgi:pyrroloquinoline quinone biosynthesis protein D
MERVGGRWMVATPDDQLHYFVAEGGEEPSDVGDRIIDLADGKRTVREIAQVICSEFEVDEPTALRDTAEFVRQLIERKVLDPSIHGGEQAAGAAPKRSTEPEGA